jgi:transcriptional regulator with XRE-family HTH domain
MNPHHHWQQPHGRPKKPAMLLPRQLRAARILAGLSRPQLAKLAGGSASAIEHFERGLTDPKQLTIERWRRALERAGVVFIEPDGKQGPGVRLRETVPPVEIGKPDKGTRKRD